MELNKIIGNRIKEVRGQLSQAAFSKKLKVTQSTIGRYEKGSRCPDAEFILLLKEHYNINPNWLIVGDDPKFMQNGLKCDEKAIYKDTKSDPEPSKITQINIEHQCIIKRFKDPERGLRINQKLIDIQDANDDLYDKVESFISGAHQAAKTMKKEHNLPQKKTQKLYTKKQNNGK